MEARTARGAGADPLVSELDRRGGARARGRRGHPPAADPDPVRGRARQHLPDRGRPADARRLRARTRGAPSTSCSTSSPSTAIRSRTSSWWCSPTSTSTTSGWSTSSSSPLRRRGRGDRQARALRRALRRGRRPRRRVRRRGDAAQRHPGGDRARAADGLVGVPRVGLEGEGHPAAARRRARSSCATARCRCCTGPATRPPTPSSGTSERRILIAADHLIKHISSNPLISRPLDDREAAPTRRSARRRSSPTWSRCARTREMPAEIVLSGHGEPITDHVRADRRALRVPPPPRGQDPRPDRRAARAPATTSRRRCSATSP